MIKSVFFTVAAASAALVCAIAPASAQQDQWQPESAFGPDESPGDWPATIARTERGHLIGNPKAKTRLIEFISYTCPHCAAFAAQGEPALEIAVLKPGTGALEVRPVIRNGLDLAVTLLAQCGDPAGFKNRHQALMLSQNEWLGKARSAPQSQQAIWLRGDKAGRSNAASALGLTQLLVGRGQSQAELDACVSNDAAAKQLVENSRADYTELGVNSTPSFVMDGKLLPEVHSWEALYPVLSARFAATASDSELPES